VIGRLLPTPLLSLAVFVSWLLLNQSLSSGHLLIAAALAVATPRAFAAFAPEPVRIGRWLVVARLALHVLFDIVTSNIDVARRILGPEARIRPGFVWLPLDIRDPHGIVTLAGIITMTPGTLSAALSDDRRALLVHALHLGDEAELIATIKQRYEAPLMEIFESCSRP
jgi:multicomponent K+:H+ antiporter subunit E